MIEFILLMLCIIILCLPSNRINYPIEMFTSFEENRLKKYLFTLPQQPITVDIKKKDIKNFKNMCENDHGLMVISLDNHNPNYYQYNKLYNKSNWSYADTYDFEIVESLISNKGNILLGCGADSFIWHNKPTLTKARFINGNTTNNLFAILCRLQSQVHFGNISQVQKICSQLNFKNKKNTVIWRGAPTGKGFPNFKHPFYEDKYNKHSRTKLLDIWGNYYDKDQIDVGLVPNYYLPIPEQYQKYIVKKKSIENLLQYKYIISIEGVDVASNLKWIMASNSIVFMPRPVVESWFLESQLIPWVHYIPIDYDYNDLLIKKQWCDDNQEKCMEIIENANKYVNNFINEEHEILLSAFVINKYLENVTINVVN